MKKSKEVQRHAGEIVLIEDEKADLKYEQNDSRGF